MAVRQPLVLGQRGTHRRGEVEITGTITVGASGAVTSFSCESVSTTGIVKNAAAGRYDIVFLRKYRNIRLGQVVLQDTSGAAFGNTSANLGQWRTATTNFHATIQLILASSGADTDTKNGTIIHFSLVAQEM